MPKISTEPIYIGCELMVRQGDSILLGLRAKVRYGGGTWGLPGGHLEFGERLIEAARREAKEELGAEVKPDDLHLTTIMDRFDLTKDKEHHVHICFEVTEPAWEPRVMEPDCAEWRYFPLDQLPDNLFPPHKPIIENYLNKKLYEN